MIFETLTNSKFPESYHSLTLQLEAESLFFSRLWFDNFLQTVVSNKDTIIWFGCKSDNGDPLLLWPLWQQSGKMFHPKRITGLANYYTTLYEPLHNIKDELLLKKIITILAQKICQQHWDFIDFYPLNPKSPVFTLIIKAFQQQQKHVQHYFIHGNWFLLTQQQTYEDYYASRPSRLKNIIKRRFNKLKKDHSIEFKICTSPSEAETALQHFQTIYTQSWKKNEPYPSFIPGLVKATASKGWLRMGMLTVNNEVAAAQIWFTLHNTAYIYKLCHHTKFANYSLGTILTAYIMEYALNNDQVNKVDFLSGDDDYKKNWMNQREERWGIQISNPKTLYGIYQSAMNFISKHFLYVNFKHFLKSKKNEPKN